VLLAGFAIMDVVISRKALSELVPIRCRGAVLMCFEDDEYEVEFVDNNGETLDVLTVRGGDLELYVESK
jgi:hypothetical protein